MATGRSRWCHRSHNWSHEREREERSECTDILAAPTAPGLRTARSLAESMAYWRWRSRRATQPPRSPRVAGTAPGTPRGQVVQTGERRERGNVTGSAQYLHVSRQRKRMRREDPQNSIVHLTRADTKEGEGKDPPPSSLCCPYAPRGWRGTP